MERGLYLLSMLVRSRLEKYVIALAPLIPCDRVRQDDLVSIPEARRREMPGLWARGEACEGGGVFLQDEQICGPPDRTY